MARRRQPSETPYQRRIRVYLERNPGATRQQARGHTLREGERSEYARRTAGAGTPEARATAAGKRGPEQFIRFLREGDVILCDIGSVEFNADTGRYGPIFKTVLPGDLRREEREFRLRNQTRASLARLIEREEATGAIFSPQPSMDQRRLLRADETGGGY